MTPSLDIVIVNWNSGTQLKSCLSSLEQILFDSFNLAQITIVDNNSKDGSANLHHSYDLPIVALNNSENRGFGYACNQGAKCGSGDYILFLNPDTIVTPESISKAIEWMEMSAAASTGVCGIKLVDDTGTISKGCTRIPDPLMLYSYTLGLDRFIPGIFPSHFMHEWPHDTSMEVDHVIGAFYLVRRVLFEKLQGFDEQFFVYMEDLDLSCRVKEHGYKIHYLAEAQAFHKGGGTSEQIKGLRLYYSLRSKLLYAKKHFSKSAYVLLVFLTLFFEFSIRVLLAIWHFSFREFTAVLDAYRLLWKSILFERHK